MTAERPGRKVAVVLFNLGGPDRPEAVQPFLFNLFNDPAIIGLPALLRWPLAKLISARRAPVAREIYDKLGGGSPLLPNTKRQADVLGAALAGSDAETDWRVFIAMRYWTPRSDETAAEVAAFGPDKVVLLPLYPQYSTTTVASSAADWRRAAAVAGLRAETHTICCYPEEAGFVEAVAARTAEGLRALASHERVRVLFSAHGLPRKVVDGGDPYQWQVERSAAAVTRRLAELDPGWRDLDQVVCYQSRVGPLEWIGPSTDDEVARAGREGVAVVVVPIAFVSEHSETLVELDIEYAELAETEGVPAYHRVPTVDDQKAFIAGLAGLARQAADEGAAVCSAQGERICPASFGRCRDRLSA